MKIKKMTATFGGLDHAVLEPGDGLTVVAAPNEAGKSTWTGFLKAMLYGIDTRERDKTGFLADKTRYLPWSGAPMAGELRLEWRGKDITIRRFPSRANPFGGFQAVYTASGDPVPGLTAANAGEQLTGVGKEAYLRSAFVGQGGAAIGASGELEARIAALATSGEEDVAYSAVERTLKDWRNRRRANRANGLIPQLEGELAALDASLREMDDARRRKSAAEEELARLERRRRELQSDLEIWARMEKHALNRRYGEAYMEWEKAKEAVPERGPHPVFGTMTGEEAWSFAQEKQGAQEAARAENRRRGALRGKLEKAILLRRVPTRLGWGLAALLAVCAVFAFILRLPLGTFLCGLGAVVALVVTLSSLRLLRDEERELAGLHDVPVPPAGDILNQAAEYREALARAAQAKAAEETARRRVDDLAAQGGQLFDTLELLHEPPQSKADTSAQLAGLERDLARTRDELARADGALAHMGGPEELEDRRGWLEGHLARRLEEYDALTIALEALGDANDALRQRFSPALNREAGELFAALTGGRWDKLTLARDFSAQAEEAGGALPRPALALSTGTAEQLYLAVRLAICRLTAPDAPLVLDDALCAFDDERCALALDCLRAEAHQRQILLFSCHSREAGWATAHSVPVIQL